MRLLVLGLLCALSACTSWEDRGDQAAALNDWDVAHASYQRAWSEDASNPVLVEKLERARVSALAMHVERSRAARAQDDLETAIRELREALRYEERQDLKEEMTDLLAERDRRRAERALGRASEHLAARRLSAAERAAREALELVPGHPPARAQLASIAAAQAKAEPALEAGRAASSSRDWAAARSAFESALTVWADHPGARDGFARATRQLDYAAAMRAGDAHVAGGRFVEAHRAFLAARKAVDTPAVRERLASIAPKAESQAATAEGARLLEQGRLSAALQLLQRAVTLDTTNRAARTGMAAALERRKAMLPGLAKADDLLAYGDFEEAIAAYDGVLRRWVDCGPAIEGRRRAVGEIRRAELIARAVAHAEAFRYRRAHKLFLEAHRIRADPVLTRWLARCDVCFAVDALLAEACACLDRHALTAACAKLEEACRLLPRYPPIRPVQDRYAAAMRHAQRKLDRAVRAHRHRHYGKAVALYDAVLACWCDCALAIDKRALALACRPF